jgi:RHS repeat-associated protein
VKPNFIILFLLFFLAGKTYGISATLSVGTPAGQAGVSPTGAAIYQIPIEAPKGINNFQPDISIVYNSQSGNGLLGYGWNLSGTSVIARTGKTYYHDGSPAAPNLSNTDNLTLDGQRLILYSGSNLTNGAKYYTEIQSYSTIACKQIGSYLGFQIITRDGLMHEYGSTANSFIDLQSSGSAVFWLLSKTTDLSGNTITYDYSKDSSTGEFYLTSITYAGNRRIEFTYGNRNDIITMYIAGKVVNVKKSLSNIKTYIGTNMLKEYKVRSSFDVFGTKVLQIEEYGPGGDLYNPVVINYGSALKTGSEYVKYVTRQGRPVYADFDGDGKTDFVDVPVKSTYTSSDKATLFSASVSSNQVTFSNKSTLALCDGFRNFLTGDFNGDGKMDLVTVRKLNNDYEFRFNPSNGSSFGSSGYALSSKPDAYVGDFDGDGKFELLTKEECKVYNIGGSVIANGGITDWGSEYVYCFPNNNYLLDFNGNGKTDILTMNGSGFKIFELNGSTFSLIYSGSDIKNSYFPIFGDFNGDGKTDILVQKFKTGSSNSYNYFVMFSTGTGFVKKDLSDFGATSKLFVMNANKDGKTDIVHMFLENNQAKFAIGRCTGADFRFTSYASTVIPSNIPVGDPTTGPYFSFSDFDGDGRDEICFDAYADRLYMKSFSDPQNLWVQTIKNGLGVVTNFEYASITDGTVYSETNTACSFPVVKTLSPIDVVKKVSTTANNYSDSTTYRYKDLRAHKQGKGVLCFKEMASTNNNQNKKITSTYEYESTYYYPYLSSIETATTSGTAISKVTNYYSTSVIKGKCIFPYVWKSETNDCLKGTAQTTDYNTYYQGLPTDINTYYGNGIREIIKTDFNIISLSDRTLTVPATLQKIRERTAVTWMTNRTWTDKTTYSYNSKGLLSKTINYTGTGSAKVSEEEYGYDNYGNATSVSTKTYSSTRALTTQYQHSADGVFLTKIIEPLNEITNSYNSLGQLTQSNDRNNGGTTQYQYDTMGRLKKTIFPDQTQEERLLAWDSSLPGGVYSEQTTRSGQPTSKSYYDALGRVLRSSATQFNGDIIHTDYTYNSAGLISRVSLPFKGSSSTYGNTYTYDSYYRLTKLTYASGKIDTYTYPSSGDSITITKGGISQTKIYDEKGILSKVKDRAGTVSYDMRPDDQPQFINTPGDMSTTILYDAYGRRRSIVGHGGVAYDAAGNINKETNGNGQLTNMVYDQYNRLTSKTGPELTTTYQYNAKNQLTKETTGDYEIIYAYDSYGRLCSQRGTLYSNQYLEKNYTFFQGNIASVQYIRNINNSVAATVENYTYSNGTLSEIKLNGSTSIWKLNAVNTFGQPTSVTTGNFTREYTYNAYGIPTGRKAGSFQNFTCTFAPATGNLTSRKDNVRSKTETFTYDNLNRLTSGVAYTADGTGNIASKSNVGNNFLYNSRPYALTGLTLTNSSVMPSAKQSVSYTSFDRPDVISEEGNDPSASFTYNGRGERIVMKTVMTSSIQPRPVVYEERNMDYLRRIYFLDCYEFDTKTRGSGKLSILLGNKEKLYLGGDFYSAPAVYVKENSGNWNIYYICRDYLGSITHITDSSGSVVQELSYDAWGRLRNPDTQAVYAPGDEPELFLGRGYTGHEHLTQFGLINMNARLYDPIVSRFLSSDPYVQMPDFSQSFNLYSYALNNPLKYTDPNGEFWWIPIAAFLLFTDMGYDIQKTISPVAIHIDLRLGNHQGGIGIDASVGIPQMFPVSYRVHGGATYFWKNEDLMGNNMSGWETRYGAEWGISGYMFGVPLAYTYGGTTFNSPWSGKQTTNLMTLGNPLINVKYENDMEPQGIFNYIPLVPKGDGDRYRTAAAQINVGPFGFGTNMITGDAGPMGNKQYDPINGKDTYIAHDGYNPNSHRMGTFYFKIGPFRFGRNSEGIRKVFQNQFAHDWLTGGQSKWFEVLNLKPRWYWGFGYSGGSTLW